MLGIGTNNKLLELLHSLDLVNKMLEAVKEKQLDVQYTDKETAKLYQQVIDELSLLRNEIEELIKSFDNDMVEEVKAYLDKDIQRLINDQNNLFSVLEKSISRNMAKLGIRVEALSTRVNEIYDEIKQLGINTVKEIAPKLLQDKLQEEIRKVIRAYLEINMYAKACLAFDKELEEKNIVLTKEEKEQCYKEIKTKVNQAIDIIIGKMEEKTNQREQSVIPPFDRDSELVHENFDKLLTCVKAGVIPMLVGPAGTGKSTAVEQVARALGLPFYTMNRIQNAFELTGYIDANGKYVSTQFYEAYTTGGIFFFDEIDASSPEALVTINTAIAQGYMAFPNGLVKMHPDFKVVAAGNTYGKGANRQYCGRNSLDSATLDRFMIIEWDYDRKIEEKVVKDKELLEFAWAVRDAVEANRYQIIISTRGIIATHKIIEASKDNKDFSIVESLEGNLFENVKVDALDKIINDIHTVPGMTNNPYFIALVELKNKLMNNKR